MEYFGFMQSEFLVHWGLAATFLALGLGYTGAPLALWTLAILGFGFGFGLPLPVLGGLGVLGVVFNLKPLRTALVSSVVMALMKKLGLLPKISATERTALEAGVVWVEKDLFSGRPDFKTMLMEPYPELTQEEKDFLAGPVEKLCAACDDFETWTNRTLSDEVWDILKRERFLGMIIPKKYGGLEFTALAHSAVIQKLGSRSVPLTVSAMVPNSLGPAELLIHYGTEAQKDYYLPRLARGEEIPCFALTEPTAGSDAASIQSTGVLFKNGEGKLMMRLSWNKRWITLAGISTVLGMAFRLRDPENLLGKGEDLGITCALVPASTKGVVLGKRHDPLGAPFHNCPTEGHDVEVSVDTIIGGLDNAGKGWGMLMDSLAAGRGISLPAQSTGGAKLTARAVSAHSVIRQQFGTPIGKFEGVGEPLSRIAGHTYSLEAMRRFTLGALDQGIMPPVITAIAKFNATEMGRQVINDGMDVMGGAGISRGKRNLLAHTYISTPIGITVEGANILTRTLMIFGQGALRAHPYAFEEVRAVENNDLKAFDAAFWGHIGHIVRNSFRSIILSVTRGRLYFPPVGGPTARYYQKLAWASASFAIMSDLAMGALGGKLKMKEKITGRFADILSHMYIGFCVLRRWEAEGRPQEDLPAVHLAMGHSLREIQKGFDGIFSNLPVPGLSWVFKWGFGVWSRFNSLEPHVDDELGQTVVQRMLSNKEFRERLTVGIYMPTDTKNEQLARLEAAYDLVMQAEGIERKIRRAIKAGKLPRQKVHTLYKEALEAEVIHLGEFKTLQACAEARLDAIQVDSFTEEEYRKVGAQADSDEESA